MDDAIVVVENVERIMSEEGLPPLEATRKSMGRSGAIVGIALVLIGGVRADGFFGGSTGNIYRQFAAIDGHRSLSAFLALIVHAGAVRHPAQAGEPATTMEKQGRLLRLVQPRFRDAPCPLRGVRAHPAAQRPLAASTPR